MPPLALSVRQPWAWAIVAGHKKIENRTAGSIAAGKMTLGPICIHAAAGLKQDEFQWGFWRLQKHAVACPRPETLHRSAIIGTATVVDIVDTSDSEWFGGPMGLILEDARTIDPIPAKGALGYFTWHSGGELAPTLPWMHSFDPMTARPEQSNLFEDLPLSLRDGPTRPTRRRSKPETKS